MGTVVVDRERAGDVPGSQSSMANPHVSSVSWLAVYRSSPPGLITQVTTASKKPGCVNPSFPKPHMTLQDPQQHNVTDYSGCVGILSTLPKVSARTQVFCARVVLQYFRTCCGDEAIYILSVCFSPGACDGQRILNAHIPCYIWHIKSSKTQYL
jgi:hypothetical protein